MSYFRICTCLTAVLLLSLTNAVADEPLPFSGPQAGESLVGFEVFDTGQDNKKTDFIKTLQGKPTLLVFVHKLTRPGIALTRSLTRYAADNNKHGGRAAIIWLDDDTVEARNFVKRAEKSLNFNVPLGVSVDGAEGPGAYGLNRNVELTVLIAKENKVTANFAILQPSVTEAAKIASEYAKLIQRPEPTSDEMLKHAYPGQNQMMRGKSSRGKDQNLRSMMQKLISAKVDTDQFTSSVKAIESWVAEKPDRKPTLLRMSNAVLERGLGTPKAQATLKKWIKEFKSPAKEAAKPKQAPGAGTKAAADADS